MSTVNNLEQVRQLEQQRFSLLQVRLKEEEVRQAKRIVAEGEGGGPAGSREISRRLTQLRLDKFEQRLVGRIGIRRQLARVYPELASPIEIARLLESIDFMVDRWVEGESQEKSVGPAGMLAAHRAQSDGACFKQRARAELDELILALALTGPQAARHIVQSAPSVGPVIAGPKKALSAGRAILQAAMQRQGLTVPKLAAKVGRILQPKSPKLKGDRAAIYRIIEGQTKKPQPAMRNALIEVLHLEGEERETVWRDLGGAGEPPSSSREKKV
jgi:hypothetical protein